MNKTRLPVLIIIVALPLAAVFAFQIVQRSTGAQDYSLSNSPGMADLNRVIPQKSGVTGFADLNRVAPQKSQITGFADLNRVASQGLLPLTGGVNSSQLSGRVCSNPSTPYAERDAGGRAIPDILRDLGCPVSAGR